MTLLVTAIAAAGSTILWYHFRQKREWGFEILCLIYWGASLMWFVDAAFALAENGAGNFFHPAGEELFSNFLLGLCVVILGLVIWLIIVLVRFFKGEIKWTHTKS